jgi:hypothetical protein
VRHELDRRRKRRLPAFALAVLTPVAAAVAAAPPASAASSSITAAADALDGACAVLQVYSGSTAVGYVRRSGDGYGFTSSVSAATSFRLEATQLSRYELLDSTGAPAYQSVVGFILAGGSYGDRADWTLARIGDRYRFTATATGQVMGSFLWSLGAG